MSIARPVHQAVSLIRADQLTLDEIYKYLTQNETNFEFDINEQCKDSGVTLLHAACAANNCELVLELLLLGAKPNLATHTGRTPLLEAIEAKSLGSIKVLISFCANVGADLKAKAAIKESSEEIQQFFASLTSEETKASALKQLMILRGQSSKLKPQMTQAKIALLIKVLEANIARYKANAMCLFAVNNADKARRLEAALQNARADLAKVTSVEAFLNYKKDAAESINDVIGARRIGFSESESKKEIESLVKSFKL